MRVLDWKGVENEETSRVQGRQQRRKIPPTPSNASVHRPFHTICDSNCSIIISSTIVEASITLCRVEASITTCHSVDILAPGKMSAPMNDNVAPEVVAKSPRKYAPRNNIVETTACDKTFDNVQFNYGFMNCEVHLVHVSQI